MNYITYDSPNGYGIIEWGAVPEKFFRRYSSAFIMVRLKITYNILI